MTREQRQMVTPNDGNLTLTSDLLNQANVHLSSEFCRSWLDLDDPTGLPTRLGADGVAAQFQLRTSFALLVGGVEQRGMHGELEYHGARLGSDLRRSGLIHHQIEADGRVYIVPIAVAGWRGELRYHLKTSAPAITWSWRLVPGPEAEAIRDVRIEMDIKLPESGPWAFHVSGTPIRSGLALAELPGSLVFRGLGAEGAAAGVIAVSGDSPETLVIWPRCITESGTTTLSPTPGGFHVSHSTRLAAVPQHGLELHQSGIALDVLGSGWDIVGADVARWLDELGLRTPQDRASWTAGATIYEAQVGTSLFAGGTWTYAPYPEIADLVADLPRIRELGFDTIQLMPKQPFPSYNVIDYDDIETTYGNVADLRAAIDWCHGHGMRFILDVLMHGVVDQESIDEVAKSVRSGRWADVVHADAATVDALGLSAMEQRTLSWSRHILDFERAWHDSSPIRHPLTEEKPDWFCRDSSGKVTGVYTKAFDVSHPEWQQYFSDKMVMLVGELGIDGFRFDAPVYNHFPNWSPRTRTRASVQELGAVTLFRSLRQRLHQLDPDLMLYTEPNGPLFRESMDLNYNYDETWLPESIFGAGGDNPPSRVRNARDLARWLADRDAALPAGSVTAHHLDSHDTFWWPLPGSKWRREQIGIDATRVLMTAFALSGGPYMMFVGGESGMEATITEVNRLRAQRPELISGTHAFGLEGISSDDLFVVRHHLGGNSSVLLANLRDQALTEDLSVQLPGRWHDLLGGHDVTDSQLKLGPFGAALWTCAS